MPIRKTDKGWYWGGQGPFLTKAKALAVARAAYANGYKEDNAIHTIQQQVRYVGLQSSKK
jgi:uncharacterized protein